MRATIGLLMLMCLCSMTACAQDMNANHNYSAPATAASPDASQIAPDLLSGMGPNGGGTSSLDRNGVGQAIQSLPPDQITADLNAVADYISKVPASNGKVVVTGYCWGGGQSFRYATNNPNIKAAFVFYGPAPAAADGTPDKAALAKIKAPVYGFYAGKILAGI